MNQPLPSIYVVILSWNDPDSLLTCLESVFASDYHNLHVVVVDNASECDIGNVIGPAYPTCHLIINERNLGYGGGCNVGLRYALAVDADYLFLLNQDTLVDLELFTQLSRVAEAQPDVAIWGPKTYSMSLVGSRLQAHSRLIYTGSWRRWVPLQQKIPDIGMEDNGAHELNRQTDYVWGHGMLIRASLLREIGLLDEDFFFYYEDIDLCRRATDAGYQLWYVADAKMWHNVDDGARSDSSELWRWRYKAHGIDLFYRKHYGLIRGTILTAVTVVDMCLHMIKKGQWLAASHLGRAWLENLAGSSGSQEGGSKD